MRKVGGILETYAYKKKFAAYGFGGVPKNEIQVSHCFNINGNPDDPTIDGLENLISEYKKSLSSVRQWGPTKFSRIMQHMDNVIKEQIQKKIEMYHILFILTDGVVHDMKQTLDAVISLSSKPVSIIIIGIGEADFTNMDILDGDDDDLRIIDPIGFQPIPDIVQFVKFNEFQHDVGMLAEQVLFEVPDQFVSYMQNNDKKLKINEVKPKSRKS